MAKFPQLMQHPPSEWQQKTFAESMQESFSFKGKKMCRLTFNKLIHYFNRINNIVVFTERGGKKNAMMHIFDNIS